MRRVAQTLVAALMAISGAMSAVAQDAPPALLVADNVVVEDGGDRLVATGNVEALRDGTTLSASSITYDRTANRLIIEGPIRLSDANGAVILADSAELEPGFRNGLLRSARMVLDEQLQLAAVEAHRVDGRYTSLSKVAATSCQVCGAKGPPLWSIRARRVIHDAEEKQIYFDNAQLRILDVPVAYLPRLRLPDPTLKRAQGFLIPRFKTTTLLGFGIKLPYFMPLGDHADLTLTPYLSPVTKTLELRYRRAFRHGDVTVNGALSRDTLQRDETRGLLFAEGGFDLPDDFRLSFDIEMVSDDSYLNDYKTYSKDRLDSALTVSRARRDSYISTGVIHYESLTDGENNATQPTIITDIQYEKRLFPRSIPGELRLGTTVHGHYRYSDSDTDGSDADSIVDGRDMARVDLDLSWRNRWTIGPGLRVGAEAHLWADHYAVRQDSVQGGDYTDVTPGASVELRWPLVKNDADGARTLIEPIAQIGWVGGERLNIPNDESTRVEFDEANLLSLSRYPAPDRRERGWVGAAGLRWLRQDPDGWTGQLVLGRVWRENADGDFSRSSGLDGRVSDWLIAGQFAHQTGLQIMARGLYDSENTRFSKAEMRAGLWKSDYSLGASYILLVEDPDEDRSSAQSQWTLDGTYKMTPRWTATGSTRYDLAENQFLNAGLGLEYRNECVAVDFSVSRSFASSTNLEPSTDYGLTVALTGFSTGGSGKEYRRSCTN